MATATVAPAENQGFISWFSEFLRSELAPYPGRGVMVARIVIAATITMILTMTFRVPGGALGAIVAFIISRENFATTAKFTMAIATALIMVLLFVPILGARMFASAPFTHFCWEVFSLLLIFFLVRTLSNFAVATICGIIGTAAVAIWYLPGPAERNLENTLWQILAPAIGAAVTIAVEAVFHAFQQQDQIKEGLDSRLQALENMLACYASDTRIPPKVEAALTQYATVSVGSLRRFLARARYTDLYRAQMSAVISLIARSVEFAAALSHTQPYISRADSELAARLAQEITEIRQFLKTGQKPPSFDTTGAPSNVALLKEIESMIALIPRVIEGSASLETFQVLGGMPEPESGFLRSDAFTNPDHLRFALSGCLAGSLCYITYVSLAWPGLSTSVLTCVITALSTIGASRQKQVLRIAGTVIGGFIFGLGAQIFILPNIDSITEFTLLFVAVSMVAAWIGTASSRLSYCGLQIAVSFDFIHLNDFAIQTSLTIGRDRTVGVLLGIAMMWLAFERLQPTTATDEMLRTFTGNLRLLADLSVYRLQPHDAASIVGIRKLRDKIYANFSTVNSQADAVPFELGKLRPQHMAARDRMRHWQAVLRTAYLLQLAILQYRVFGSTEKLSDSTEKMLQEFDQSCARTLNGMAAYLEAQRTWETSTPRSLAQNIESPAFPPGLAAAATDSTLLPGSLFSLAHELLKILERLRDQMLAAPLFALE